MKKAQTRNLLSLCFLKGTAKVNGYKNKKLKQDFASTVREEENNANSTEQSM